MNSNIYEFNAASILERYADFIDGCPNDIVAVLSQDTLSETAKKAISSSAAKLGYGEDSCSWVRLSQDMEVRRVIEGLDPVAMIATDRDAASALGSAFDQTLEPDAHKRILGREVVAFSDFENMLTDSDKKQRAWALLKKMNRVRH